MTHVFPALGTYCGTLTVWDNEGLTSTIFKDITVLVIPEDIPGFPAWFVASFMVFGLVLVAMRLVRKRRA